jgi:tetratricopeptide (TPR) repeat protein
MTEPASLPSRRRRLLLSLLLGLAAAALPLAAQDVPEVVRELLEQSESQRAAGRLDEAIGTLEEARRLDPSVAQIHVALGALQHQRGDLPASLEAFRAGLQALPEDRSLLFNAAVVALALEKFDEARGFAAKALQKNPKDVDLLLLEAAALDRQGKREDALAGLLKADKLRPNDAQVQFRLGNLYHAMGRGNEAVEAYRKALKKDPGLLRAQSNLGAVLFSLGRNQEALEAYRAALSPVEKALLSGEQVDPLNAVAFANLGSIHRQLGQWRPALQAYFTALQLDPKRRELLVSRGFVQLQLGQLDEAAADYQDALADDPKSGPALLGLGLIESRRGRCAPAVDFLERGFASFDSAARIEALQPLARCYAALGRGDDAEKAFRTLIEGRQDDSELLFALGRLLRGQGKDAEAETWLAKAHTLEPEHLGASLELLALAEKRGDQERQMTLAEDLLRRHGARQELWPLRASLALLYVGAGRAAEALPHYAALEAVKNVPAAEKAELQRCHGLALAAAGKYEEARKRLRGTSDAMARSGGSNGALAFVEAMAGNGEAALAALGGARDPAQRANLGLLLWSIGRGDEAKQHLEAATAAPGATGAAVRIALADLALRRGDAAGAGDQLAAAQAACQNAKADDKLCAHQRTLREAARGQQAQAELARALRADAGSAQLRQLGEEMVAAHGPKDPRRPFALLLRGTSRLLAGDAPGAEKDFEAALAEAPTGELEKSLRGNLAVAVAQQGRAAEARRLFEAQREPIAQLDLGILLENEGKGPEALPFYLAYLQSGGGDRRQEVEGWVARLREVSP